MGWTVVELGKVTSEIDRSEVVRPETAYDLLGMRSKIGGPFLRETKLGMETSTTRLTKVRAGDFIYSRLFAWQGSFGVIPEELDGCYVSNEFPLFEVDGTHLDSRFLTLWFGLPSTQRLVEEDCYGSTPGTRNRFKEEHFKKLKAPLPPLDEQRRIVARLDHVASLVEEARQARGLIQSEKKELVWKLINGDQSSPSPTVEFGKLASLKSKDVIVIPDEKYQFAGVYSFGRGLFCSGKKLGSEFSYSELTTLRVNDFTYPKLMAWEGALGVVPSECDGCVVSPEFPVFEIDADIILPAVLDAYFRSAQTWPRLGGTSRGTNVRRRRLNPKVLADLTVPIPSMPVQECIRDIMERLDPFGFDQDSSDLDALIPATLREVFGGAVPNPESQLAATTEDIVALRAIAG